MNPNDKGYDLMDHRSPRTTGRSLPRSAGSDPYCDPPTPEADRHDLAYTSGEYNQAANWIPVTVNLGGYLAETILLRFTFDTHDGLYNGFRGWFIDDIKICPEPALPWHARRAAARTAAVALLKRTPPPDRRCALSPLFPLPVLPPSRGGEEIGILRANPFLPSPSPALAGEGDRGGEGLHRMSLLYDPFIKKVQLKRTNPSKKAVTGFFEGFACFKSLVLSDRSHAQKSIVACRHCLGEISSTPGQNSAKSRAS